MKNKIMTVLCCLLMICLISGCQLAAGEVTYIQDDKLIGVFITRDNALPFEDRKYAFMEMDEFVFRHFGEIIPGILYFSLVVTDEHGPYITTKADNAISDISMHIVSGDHENSTAMEGTVFVTPSVADIVFYINPVYQDFFGDVFVVAGDAISMSGTIGSGSAMTSKLENVTEKTENGVTETESFSVSVSFKVMYAPELFIITQMNAGNIPVSTIEHSPDAVPEYISPETDTAYFIVETHSYDETGNLLINREIYSREDEDIKVFIKRADGILTAHMIQINQD